jgi:DNA-binding NtrC family response regulator
MYGIMTKISPHIPEYKPKAPVFVYASGQIKKVMEQATKVAKDQGCKVTTILGEPGVMKSELARWIAHKDPRKGKIIEISCGYLPETLFESELYGRKKWAHNDARETRIGLVEEAHGGVCIFDDINCIPINQQKKLAYFIEHGVIKQIGCNIFRKVDVKKIATTNVVWKTAIRDGLLDKDLYNRLNNFRIHIPPLRDRKEDIMILANHFLKQKAAYIGRANSKFSPKVKNLFMQYHWPGNVRELQQTVESSVTRCDKNTIFLGHLPEDFGEGSEEENQSNRIQDEFQKNLMLLGRLLSSYYLFNFNNIHNTSPDLDNELKEFLSFIITRDDPIIYRLDYSTFKGISKASANRFLKKMVEIGVLYQEQRGRGTYYKVSLKRVLELINRLKLTF